MPTYIIECACEEGHIHDQWYPIATGVPARCPDCGDPITQHYTPPATISPATRVINGRDAALSKNRDAYKRLRHNGLQPPHIGGSADLETHAESQFEINYGQVLDKGQLKEAREGIDRVQDVVGELAQ